MIQATQVHSEWLSGIEAFCQSSHMSVPVLDVFNGALRLDAGLYASEGYQSRHDFECSGLKEITLNDACSKIFDPPIFKRTFTEEEFGVPYINSSQMQEARPDLTKRYISKDTKDLDLYVIEENDILIAAAGTVGNVVIATSDLAGAAGTSDIMRLRSFDDYVGTVYSTLLSPYGQFLLAGYQYGSVVQRIRAHQVAHIKIPLFPQKLRDELTRLIRETCSLRTKANALLTAVDVELQDTCKLPDLADLNVENLIDNDCEAMTFSWTSTQRLAMSGQFGTLRLDATYHEPTSCLLAKQIMTNPSGCKLGDITLNIYRSNLRKRVFVDEPEAGISMIGGKHLVQQRCSDIKYLSKSLTRGSSSEAVKPGWTLVTCGGTLGRVQFVHRNFENWSVSEDVMRIIPNEDKVYSGFLYAFLASPYGQIQIAQNGYGSVIPRLRDFQLKSIAIPVPADNGKSIHVKVIQAFDARADAQITEDKAIELFMSAIRDGKDAVESTWGRDY